MLPQLLNPNAISFIFLVVFLYARTLPKKNLALHKKLMFAVITADVGLVVFLTFTRNALGQLNPDMSLLLSIHVPIAVSTVLCYPFAIYYGLKVSSGNKKYLKNLRVLDKIVTPLRVLTFVSSLMLQVLS